MLQSILLIMGIVYAFRKPKLKALTSGQFPNVPPAIFAEWQKLELESINLFLWGAWGVTLLSILAQLVQLAATEVFENDFPGGEAAIAAVRIGCVVLFLVLVILSAIQGSKAGKLKKEFDISSPIPLSQTTSSLPSPSQPTSLPTVNSETSVTPSSGMPAPQIDRLLENMTQKQVDRVLLRPDQPMLLSKNGQEFNGPILNKERLLSVTQEVTPPQWQPQLQTGISSPFQFNYQCVHGNFDVAVENSSAQPGDLQVAITRAAKSTAKPRALERDNKGTRHETLDYASSYWMARNVRQKFDPFVMYVFDEEQKARAALLELDCIQEAADTGKLICTETLIFGYYRTESGKYEALICGDDLSHDLWSAAHASFIKHGGVKKGEQEPEKMKVHAHTKASGDASKVRFVREERSETLGNPTTYCIYEGPDAASAKAFLDKNPVTKPLYFLVVETPEGNYCRDKDGMYKE